MRAAKVATLAVLVTVAALPASAQNTGVVALQEAVVNAIARAERSVVAIAIVPKNQTRESLGIFDLQRQLLDPDQFTPNQLDPNSPDFLPGKFASGVIVDKVGHVLTTYHSLGDPRLHDYYIWYQGESMKAVRVAAPPKVLAGDPWTDLALFKVPPIGKPIEFADTKNLRKGTFAISLGNPYALARDGQPSAAWGIVANLRRAAPPLPVSGGELPKQSLHHYRTLIQVDLKLPLGTSGGPLIDLQGRMIGLATSLAPLVGAETSAGFAIPVDETMLHAIDVMKSGRIPAFGFLGVQPEDLSPDERRAVGPGARVVRVVSGTAAADAGITVGDIITHVNEIAVRTKDDLIREVSRLPAHTKVRISLHRSEGENGKRVTKSVTVDLNKKPLDSWLIAYESARRPNWRGMEIDESTAVPPILRRETGAVPDPQGCVGVLRVDHDSPSWRAGIRPGMFVTHVNGKRVRTPDEFHSAVKSLPGPVELQILTGAPGKATITVRPRESM